MALKFPVHLTTSHSKLFRDASSLVTATVTVAKQAVARVPGRKQKVQNKKISSLMCLHMGMTIRLIFRASQIGVAARVRSTYPRAVWRWSASVLCYGSHLCRLGEEWDIY